MKRMTLQACLEDTKTVNHGSNHGRIMHVTVSLELLGGIDGHKAIQA
jgi:hypothetical protein